MVIIGQDCRVRLHAMGCISSHVYLSLAPKCATMAWSAWGFTFRGPTIVDSKSNSKAIMQGILLVLITRDVTSGVHSSSVWL